MRSRGGYEPNLSCDRRGSARGDLRRGADQRIAAIARRQRQDARNRCGDSGRRLGLSSASVHHHRHRRRGDPCGDLLPSRRASGGGLPHRRGAVGRGGLRGHADLCARQRAHGPSGVREPGQGPLHGLPLGRRDGPVRGRLRAPRRHRLLPRPHRRAGPQPDQPRRGGCSGGPRLRRFAHLHLRPSRRRHLHQGRRRGRRHGGQGRGWHS